MRERRAENGGAPPSCQSRKTLGVSSLAIALALSYANKRGGWIVDRIRDASDPGE
jgi:hypothetical protein